MSASSAFPNARNARDHQKGEQFVEQRGSLFKFRLKSSHAGVSAVGAQHEG